jgi:UDP-glucose 4-epimerase
VRDPLALNDIFGRYPIRGVIHFAALKAVGESMQKPLEYYENNVTGLIHLVQAMAQAGCRHLVLSSSATVYGDPQTVPITEHAPLAPTSPYGQTKLMSEQILRDLEQADPSWKIAYLRYFNPIGAHPSGLIGEDPLGLPNNLVPFLAKVAVGAIPILKLYGNDWPTPDGTGVRDYLHVIDLAKAHTKAINFLLQQGQSLTVNLGTGRGYSVFEVIRAYEKASGRSIPYEIVGRRTGDIASCFADPSRAKSTLGWSTQFGLDEMCEHSWNWQKNNPHGYA